MSETPDEREARQDAALAELQGEDQPAGTPAEPAPDAPKLAADGDPVKSFGITGTFDAEDQHDAYKLLQAHFLALSRGDAGTLDDVQVQVA
jgi:hypothetical protein